MTKEKLYETAEFKEAYTSRPKLISTRNLDEFFESNVVIPKGENRHPYADVLHEWVEGADLQCKNIDEWHDIKHIKLNHQAHEYRIKPYEPVYEWQWYKIVDGVVQVKNELGKDGRDQFFTEEETSGFGWIRFEETKRERK